MKKFKTVDELINVIKPSDPVYCIRKNSIKKATKVFLQNFPGKILYAVKTNPHPFVVKTLIESGIKNFDVASPTPISTFGWLFQRLFKNSI